MNKKKVIVFLIILVIVLSVFVYFYIKSKKQKTEQKEVYKIEKIIPEEVFFVSDNINDGINFLTKNQEIHRWSNNTNEYIEKINQYPENVFWSTEPHKLIYTIEVDKKDSYGNKLPLNLEYYLFTNGKEYYWGNGLGDVVWSNNSDFAFYSITPGTSFYNLPLLIKRNTATGAINDSLEKQELFEASIEITSTKNQILFCPTIEKLFSYLYDINSNSFSRHEFACQTKTASFSPKADFIAFLDKKENKIIIYNLAKKDKKEVSITDLKNGPTWSTDGKFIFIIDRIGPEDRIFKIDVSTLKKNEIVLKNNNKPNIQKIIVLGDDLYLVINNYLFKASN